MGALDGVRASVAGRQVARVAAELLEGVAQQPGPRRVQHRVAHVPLRPRLVVHRNQVRRPGTGADRNRTQGFRLQRKSLRKRIQLQTPTQEDAVVRKNLFIVNPTLPWPLTLNLRINCKIMKALQTLTTVSKGTSAKSWKLGTFSMRLLRRVETPQPMVSDRCTRSQKLRT